MATMKDIARMAGVSHGTVSNVMNGRGNVSSEKIYLVEKAAKELGYNISAQAQRLRKEQNRLVAILLPNIDREVYRVFYNTLVTLLEGDGYETAVYFSEGDFEREKDGMQSALSDRPACIVAYSCAPDPATLYGPGRKVVLVNHPLATPGAQQCGVQMDFAAVSDCLLAEVERKGYRSVAFFMDSEAMPENRVMVDGTATMLRALGAETESFYYNTRVQYNGAIEILQHEPAFDLVVTCAPGRVDKLRQVSRLIDRPMPAVITLAGRETLPHDEPLRLEMDFRALAHRVHKRIQDAAWDGGVEVQPVERLRRMQAGPPPAPARELSLLTSTSPTADILQSLAPHLYRRTGIRLRVVALHHEELLNTLAGDAALPFDLIRMDMVWRSRFEQRLCTPLNIGTGQLAGEVRGFLPEIRARYCAGDEAYTLPFDPSVQMLFYRKDLFQNPTLRRLYYETHHSQLEVPGNFAEFDNVAEFFTRRDNPQSPTKYGATMTYGGATVAACDLLPRVVGAGVELFGAAGAADLTSPGMLKVVEEYVRLKRSCSPEVNHWWGDSLALFAAGMAAMTIVFINHASRTILANNATTFDKVGAAAIPGGTPLLGGGCIGVNRQSRSPEDCFAFLQWVYSDEVAGMVTLLGGLSPVASVFHNEEVLELYPWLRGIGGSFARGTRSFGRPAYPNFDEAQFERIIGTAVRSAAMGVTSAADALAAAQRQYEKAFAG